MNNAAYLSYFEVGRVEWLRDAGISYRKLEEQGYGFVVVEGHINYKRAAFFDDELLLRTDLAEVNRASLRFEYTLLRGEEVIATGYTRHGCVELSSERAVRIPKEVLQALKSGKSSFGFA